MLANVYTAGHPLVCAVKGVAGGRLTCLEEKCLATAHSKQLTKTSSLFLYSMQSWTTMAKLMFHSFGYYINPYLTDLVINLALF